MVERVYCIQQLKFQLLAMKKKKMLHLLSKITSATCSWCKMVFSPNKPMTGFSLFVQSFSPLPWFWIHQGNTANMTFGQCWEHFPKSTSCCVKKVTCESNVCLCPLHGKENIFIGDRTQNCCRLSTVGPSSKKLTPWIFSRRPRATRIHQMLPETVLNLKCWNSTAPPVPSCRKTHLPLLLPPPLQVQGSKPAVAVRRRAHPFPSLLSLPLPSLSLPPSLPLPSCVGAGKSPCGSCLQQESPFPAVPAAALQAFPSAASEAPETRRVSLTHWEGRVPVHTDAALCLTGSRWQRATYCGYSREV